MAYDEQFFLTRVGPTFFDLYLQAGRMFGDDPASVVWPARTLADINMGMESEASLSKHAAECSAGLGLRTGGASVQTAAPTGTSKYDEQFFLNRVGPTFFGLYASVSRKFGDDPQSVVWPARTLADIDMGMSNEASLSKHAAECQTLLNAPPPYTGPIVPGTLHGTLRPAGRFLANDAGRYLSHGISAFRLGQMLANGEDIEPFLSWVSQQGCINYLRVFTMVRNMFHLAPDVGANAIGDVYRRTGDIGCYVEAVCLSDVYDEHGNEWWPGFDPASHVATVSRNASQFMGRMIEVCNEPLQKWQRFDPEDLQQFATAIPAGTVYALGAPDGWDDESRDYLLPGISFGTVHSCRLRAPWGNVRHTREIQVTADDCKLWMVNDEPAREITRAQNFGTGALCAVCRIGDTFHSEWGKQCTIPNPDEREQFNCRRRGWASVPDSFEGGFQNTGWAESPVKSMPNAIDGDSRAYSVSNGHEAYTAVLHTREIEWREGWVAEKVDEVDEGGGEVATTYHVVRHGDY